MMFEDNKLGPIGVTAECRGAVGVDSTIAQTPKFLIEAAGILYGPFDSASDAADWFSHTRPHYMAPWKIVPIRPPVSES